MAMVMPLYCHSPPPVGQQQIMPHQLAIKASKGANSPHIRLCTRSTRIGCIP